MKKMLAILMAGIVLIPSFASANVNVLPDPGLDTKTFQSIASAITQKTSKAEIFFSKNGISTDFKKRITILHPDAHYFSDTEDINNTYLKNQSDFIANYNADGDPFLIGQLATKDLITFTISNNPKIAKESPYWLRIGVIEDVADQVIEINAFEKRLSDYRKSITSYTELPNIADLFNTKDVSKYAEVNKYDSYTVSLHSYVATHYLIYDVAKNPQSGINYLTLLNQGMSHEIAFKTAFGLTDVEFYDLFEKYTKSQYSKETKVKL